jgi:YesN/AraC family two-component response regulator
MEKNFNYYTKDLTVLYAEDDADLRANIIKILCRFFKTVHEFENGKLALDFWMSNQDSIDIILTDLTMPIMSGFEFASRVRDIDDDQKIIILSAHSEQESLFRLIDIGVDGFLPKPPTKEQMQKLFFKIGKIVTERKELLGYTEKLEEQMRIMTKNERIMRQLNTAKAILTNTVYAIPVAQQCEVVLKMTETLENVELIEVEEVEEAIFTPFTREIKIVDNTGDGLKVQEFLRDDIAEMREIIDDIDQIIVLMIGSGELTSEFIPLLEKLLGYFAKYSFILKSYPSFQFFSDKLFELSCALRHFLSDDTHKDLVLVIEFLECMNYSLLMFQQQVIEEQSAEPNFYDASFANDIDTIIGIITHKEDTAAHDDLVEFF